MSNLSRLDKLWRHELTISGYPFPINGKASNLFNNIALKDECWFWNGAKNTEGYGYFYFNKKTLRVIRVLFEVLFRPLRPAEVVMHVCDNPSCVRPEHLRAGTPAENNKDRATKGRNRNQSGVLNSQTKLTYEDVVKIRNLHSQGLTNTQIAPMFNVSRGAIYLIVTNKRWNTNPKESQ